MPYEYHSFEDSKFKVIFHTDYRNEKDIPVISKNQIADEWLHWHKNPELLLCLSREMRVFCNGVSRIFRPGELAIVNRNEVHDVTANFGETSYHCLIVDYGICDIELLPARSSNPEVIALYNRIVAELQEKKENYKEAVMGYIKVMFSLLSREIPEDNISAMTFRKVEITTKAIEYMSIHFQEDISLKEISGALNLNKHYLSHVFKEITGNTVIENLNYIRCRNAHSMLLSGKYNVTQSAYASGFTNLSYFSRTYKRIIGNSPTEDISK